MRWLGISHWPVALASLACLVGAGAAAQEQRPPLIPSLAAPVAAKPAILPQTLTMPGAPIPTESRTPSQAASVDAPEISLSADLVEPPARLDEVLEPPSQQDDAARSRSAKKSVPTASRPIVPVMLDAEDNEPETVTERHGDGSVKIERQVVLDPNGNYINHGPYTMFDRRGKTVMTGQFRDGKPHGVWTRFFTADDGYVLSTKDAQAFGGPFISRANFVEGQFHGGWTITTRSGEKVLELQFRHGALDGKQTWWYPSGYKRREMDFTNGQAEGQYLEWDSKGKLTSRLAVIDGKVLSKKVAWYADGRKQYEGWYLSAQMISGRDYDWWKGTVIPVPTSSSGPAQKHGPWASWYSNGQKKITGEFDRDVPVGKFTWWYENGQTEAEGRYTNGQKDGVWTTWHPNGQKASKTEYLAGAPVRKGFRWGADGRLMEAFDFSMEAPQPPEAQPRVSAYTADEPQP